MSARLTERLREIYGADWQLHLEPDPEPEPPTCGTCRGGGWLVKRSGPEWDPSHHDFGKTYPCPDCKTHELEQARLVRIFGAAEIPERLRPLTFATYAALGAKGDQTARAGMEMWAREGTGSVYLWGRIGRGKTALAKCAMWQRMTERNEPALFRTTPDLLGRIRDTFNRSENAPTEAEVKSAITSAPLLVLDDIGVDKPTAWVTTTLYTMINDRYNAGRPTIFTSNYDLVGLGEQLGSRMPDRIREMCGGNVLHVQGDNLRTA